MVAKCFYCGNQNVTVAHIKSCSEITHTKSKPALLLATSPQDMAAKMTALATPDAEVKVTTSVATPSYKADLAKMKAKWAADKAAAAAAVVVIPTHAEAAAIDSLTAVQAAAKPVQPQDMEIGFYFHEGDAYKIVWNKSQTKKYAMKLYIQPTWGKNGKTLKGTWVYDSGSIFKLQPEHKMSKEVADNYATSTLEKYGVAFCCVCGKKLTAKESVSAGIGPVCSSKLGI